MKKFALLIVLISSIGYSISASTIDLLTGGGFGLKEYVTTFGTRPPEEGSVFVRGKYFTDKDSDIYKQISAIANKPNVPDTAFEFAVTSYFTATVNDRPVRAAELLPANSKQSVLILGAAGFQEIQILRFLGNTEAVGRYEGVLKIITDRGNVKREEIEAYYRNNIRGLVSATVDGEFNRISFFIRNIIEQQASSYDGVLTRNPQNGQYTLSYERASVANSNKILTATSLEALASAMRNSGDFVPAAIDTVKAQATLIPAVVDPGEVNKVKQAFVDFFINPRGSTFAKIVELYNRYPYEFGTRTEHGQNATASLYNTVVAMNPGLGPVLLNPGILSNR